MHIVHIAAELAPIAKVGGLGDVILGLGRELKEKGHTVEVIMPKYDCLHLEEVDHLQVALHDLDSYFAGEWQHNTVWRGIVRGLPVVLIESHDREGFFERQTIYGCPDDVARFSYFSRAALEYLSQTEQAPEILHIHDWHAALVPLLKKKFYNETSLSAARTVLTIHNLAYQGHCMKTDLAQVGLVAEEFDAPHLLGDHHRPGHLNLLQGGIVFSDYVTTVSPNYAHEALTPEGGKGLERTLQQHKEKFSGVLNGIDYDYWDPSNDPHLPFHFSIKNLSHQHKKHPFIEEKAQLKAHLRQILSLDEEECPIVSCISRLVYQKGPELMKYALLKTLELGGQFVMIGSAMDPKTHAEFYNLKRKLAESRHVHIELNYNEPLSHLIYAASDLFLVPSIFEPCGLTQMIAMRYGTVPLVRKTGGLADTVFEGKNGFIFKEATAEGILHALTRALHCWFEAPDTWRSLMSKGMEKDFSWRIPSEEYLHIYSRL